MLVAAVSGVMHNPYGIELAIMHEHGDTFERLGFLGTLRGNKQSKRPVCLGRTRRKRECEGHQCDS